jgi:hypothetical protein
LALESWCTAIENKNGLNTEEEKLADAPEEANDVRVA